MSDIHQVDVAFRAKQVISERRPAQDFSRELAKTGGGKLLAHANPHDNPAVNWPARAFVVASKPPVDAQLASALTSAAVTCAVATHEQLGVAVQPTGITEALLGSGVYGVHLSANALTSAFVTCAVATQEQLGVAVQPTGITEALLGSRVYGVHLLASAYLSELTTRGDPDPDPLPDVRLPATVEMPTQSHAAVSDISPDLSGTTHDASLHDEMMAMLGWLVEGEATEAISHTQSKDSVSAASTAAVTMSWPESSLRLTKQRDGSAVIWLRDYRMPYEGASQVVDALVKRTETAGIRLGRIVLNGREVWTSPENY